MSRYETQSDGRLDAATQTILSECNGEVKELEKMIVVMRKALNLASDFGAYLWWCVECNEAGWADDMCEHIGDHDD